MPFIWLTVHRSLIVTNDEHHFYEIPHAEACNNIVVKRGRARQGVACNAIFAKGLAKITLHRWLKNKY